MANFIDQTWLAFAWNPPTAGATEQAIHRVGLHYQSLYGAPLRAHRAGSDRIGLVLWENENQHVRFPLWHEGDGIALATTSPLIPEGRPPNITSQVALADRIARQTLADPESASELHSPFTMGVYSSVASELVIANDVLGTGRLFEMEGEAGVVWSNRLGALPIFLGREPSMADDAWLGLVATGWFPGNTTALKGAQQHRGASIIRVSTRGRLFSIERRRNLSAIGALVRPRRARLSSSVERAAESAVGLATSLAQAWDMPLTVDLSGGRDSRISAAAALRSSVPIKLRTSNIELGELDVVRSLLARLDRDVAHEVKEPESEPADDLWTRVTNLHLVHDGMRNPQAVLRTPMVLPHRESSDPVLSGHGGELGHGFYYGDRKTLRRLRTGGDRALIARLEKSARRKHDAAFEHAYETFIEHALVTLSEGKELGLKGPTLLDYYYLTQRLANRSGLTTRNTRWSACSTRAFVRAAFDLRPEQRLKSKLHRRIVANLYPSWARMPYYERGESALVTTRRVRIWDKVGHREQLNEIIENHDSWHPFFRVNRVKELWRNALKGAAHQHYEGVFTRIVWIAGFELHLRTLARSARAVPTR